MERIGKALEKIYNDGVLSRDFSNDQLVKSGKQGVEQIQYTQTRSVEVSQALLRQNRVIAGYEPGVYVDSYKILRTRVLQKLREHGWNALAITSPSPNSGKTLTAINLAISLALEINQTVLLVDANLKNPHIHKYFGFQPQYGLDDYLLDNVPVEKILVNPKGFSRFIILPGRRALPESSEMLSSPKMNILVDELKNRYPTRIVLFDLPHLATADALAFAPFVDAALLVVEAGKTKDSELDSAITHLQHTPIIGTVLNKAEVAPPND